MAIPISKPLFGVEEMEAVVRPLESGWVVQGPFVKTFEDKFSRFTGAGASVATSSCTTALHLAVAALGLKAGDEVIVPAFTWISTANVVEYMGARPVFVDVELDTFNIDVARIADAITPRTVGIIAVHLFGLAADLDPILALAQARGLWVVEDAACAFGAWYHGRHAGTLGDAGCFSFHPRKSITTGEGGMLTTNRQPVADLARVLRDHGASRSDLSRHEGPSAFLLSEYRHLGYNYRMTDIQGALGCAQMDRAADILAARGRIAREYDAQVGRLEWLRTPVVPHGFVHGYQAYVCLFRPDAPSLTNVERLSAWRNRVMTRLEEQGIATRQGTHAPIGLDYYRDKYSLHPHDFPNAYLADRLTLALPLFAQLTEAEQSQVVGALQPAMAASS